VSQGHDPQLEKAVEVVMDLLKKNPAPARKRPPYPNYHQRLPSVSTTTPGGRERRGGARTVPAQPTERMKASPAATTSSWSSGASASAIRSRVRSRRRRSAFGRPSSSHFSSATCGKIPEKYADW